MPQEINLNVAPYYDDFDAESNFHKVLFKPGTPVQARELTGLQSILQNQIETFGTHIFKEGAKVIPGNIHIQLEYNCVVLNNSFNGIPLSLYEDQLVGKRIRGESSGFEGRVDYVLSAEDSEIGLTTLYYTETTGSLDTAGVRFFEDEVLVTLDEITYGNNVIAANQQFARTNEVTTNSAGALSHIEEGVYFIRGNFVTVPTQTIIVTQYVPLPTARVGLTVNEDIVTSFDDESLADNAQGFSNYAAPGADRLKISATLDVRFDEDTTPITFVEDDDTSFIELIRIVAGEIQTFVDNSEYNHIKAEFARRTFDESGDYYVKPFNVIIKNQLNNFEGNNGTLNPGDFSPISAELASDEVMEYVVTPGKAYVRGFEVQKTTNFTLEVFKPRETNSVTNRPIPINIGPEIRINNVHGSPVVGFGTTVSASLRNAVVKNVGVGSTSPAGEEIGQCKIYDFNMESANVSGEETEYAIRLFDIAPFTGLSVNQAFASLPKGSHVKGKYSGASGFVVSDASSLTTFNLSGVTGKFLAGEKLVINGVNNNTTVAIATAYSLTDVKSIYQGTTVGITTFNANLKFTTKQRVNSTSGGLLQITGRSGDNGISTITGPRGTFVGILTDTSLVRFISTESTDPKVLQVNNVGLAGTFIEVVGIETCKNVFDGATPLASQQIQLEVLSADSINVDENTLFTRIDDRYIDSVNLTDSRTTIRKTYENLSSSEFSIALPIPGVNETYRPFDQDRYNLVYSDGSTQPLTDDMFDISSDGKVCNIDGLDRESETEIKVIATLTKSNLIEKKKNLNTTSSIVINRSINPSSGIGTTTLGDGLEYSTVYGTRVQDDKISLNKPDVLRVLAIYESNNTNDPQAPTLTLSEIDGSTLSTADFILGEKLIATGSKAAAVITRINSPTTVEIVYLNDKIFELGEVVSGQESGINAKANALTYGDTNITPNYDLDNGQRGSFYDYGRIILKKRRSKPSRKIKVYFQNYVVNSNDTGDFFTSESFDDSLYSASIPEYQGVRNTDIIDIRPRVGTYDSSSNISPFDFDSRSYVQSGQSVSNTLVSGEQIFIDYEYYLGRIDKIFLDSFAKLSVVRGVPSDDPQPPADIDGAMKIAQITLPPYLFSTSSAQLQRVQHKRYQMKDISHLEARITNLEFYTALSLLEKETEAFTIQDAKGLDRFKAGFFVDNFSSFIVQDQNNPDLACSIDTTNGQLRPKHFTTGLDLVVATTAISGIGTTDGTGFIPVPGSPSGIGTTPNTIDTRYNNVLPDPNLRKTGDLITLNYDEVTYLENRLASRTENVNPFLVTNWTGSLKLYPSSDFWVDQKVIATNETDVLGPDFVASIENVGIDEGLGFDEIEWGSWSDRVIGREDRFVDKTTTKTTKKRLNANDDVKTTTTTVTRTTNDTEIREFTRQGTAIKSTSPHIEKVVVHNRVLSRDAILYMRSRNVEWTATRMKPHTKVYPSIDNVDVTEYMTPKLLEIEMESGVFEVGETVKGETPIATIFNVPVVDTNGNLRSSLIKPSVLPSILFRVAQSNHKKGPFDQPTSVYDQNPYDSIRTAGREVTVQGFRPIPENYTAASTILNVDTTSLSKESEGDFLGYARPGMVLRGQTSGAVAIVKEVRLVTDSVGSVVGSLYIPDPSYKHTPKFENGTKTFKLGDYKNLTFISAVNTTSAEANFQASGVLEFTEEDVLSVRSTSLHQAVFTDTDIKETILNSSQAVISETSEDTILRNVRKPPARSGRGRPSRPSGGGGGGNQGPRRPAPTGRSWTIGRIAQGPGKSDKLVLVDTAELKNFKKTPGYSGTQTYTQPNNPINGWGIQSFSQHLRNCKNGRDPLAQSFYVNRAEGLFITSCDAYFASKDTNLPVTMQVRTMKNGVPTLNKLAFSETEVYPEDVNISQDASEPTRFTFESPVYLEGNHEYAVVLLSDSKEYNAYISRMGEEDITGGIANPDAPRRRIDNQPLMGSLFKSQNGSTWDASQFEDLKMTLRRADFVTDTQGTASFYNPGLREGNTINYNLGYNPVETFSKVVNVGLGTTLSSAQETILVDGVNVSQVNNTTAKGVIINTYGSISQESGSTTIAYAGIGYTPSSGIATYANTELTTLSGSGFGAEASVTVLNGEITSVSITAGGSNYAVGDEVGITTLGVTKLGRDARISVGILSAISSFDLDQVQGVFNTGIAATMAYIDQTTGAFTPLTASGAALVDVRADTITEDTDSDGLHLQIRHRNHGINASNQRVLLNNVQPDSTPTKVSSDGLTIQTTNSVVLEDASGFETFENVGVGTTNPGYAVCNGEIFAYTGVIGGTTLTDLTRGVDSTPVTVHKGGDFVSKYELNGVSLRRINKVHIIGDATATNAITLDTYKLKIDMTDNGIDRSVNTSFPKLSFNSVKQCGGEGGALSEGNIQYEALTPYVETMIPPETTLDLSVKTITASSIDGNEEAFVETGFVPVVNKETTYFDTPRAIYSDENEIFFGTLNNISDQGPERTSSFVLHTTFETRNSYLSPVVDTDRVGAILTSNRINSPVENYAEDNRIRVTGEDPHAAVYVSKYITLQNPANSLKVICKAYRDESADIRVLYKIFDDTNDLDSVPYNLMPGYDNIDDLGAVIDVAKNNGLPNVKTPASKVGEFRDYEWFVDDLPEFTGFQIKIVMSGTNQARPPIIEELRAIAVR